MVMKKRKIKKVSSKETKNNVQVVVNDDYLKVLWPMLKKARRSIDILSFSFAIGSSSGKLTVNSAPYEIASTLKLLKEKKGEKLRIRFFTEGFRETEGRNRVTGDFLKAAGVKVRYGRTHAKGFCIDEKIVLFGSTNLTQQSILKNNEANLLINDRKLSKGFMLYFEHLWKGGKQGQISLPPPFIPDGSFKDALIEMIDKARRKIEFSIYFFNQREIENALIRAYERGVKVSGFIHQHASFALSYIWANRSTVKRLKEAGITDLYWGPPHKFSHSKYIIVDNKDVALGTGNWLNEDVLIHPQLYIHLKDVTVAKNLSRHFKWQIENSSQS